MQHGKHCPSPRFALCLLHLGVAGSSPQGAEGSQRKRPPDWVVFFFEFPQQFQTF
jgi:hypothetical protein